MNVIIYPYNEQTEQAYSTKCVSYYQAAHAPFNIAALNWISRMSRDAVVYDYPYSTTKHLYELYTALGSPVISDPPAKPVYDMDVTPVNIQTADPSKVEFFVTWWLLKLYANSPDQNIYWMNAIVLNPEPGHTPGWTADTYWPDKMIAAYPQ